MGIIRTVEWDSSKENDPEFLIKYYEDVINYWSQYPEHISRKIITRYSQAVKSNKKLLK